MTNDFSLLRQKKILEILDGDIEYGYYLKGTVAMPRLSGVTICNISVMLGFRQEYSNLSRWQYLDNLLKYCIEHDKIQKLLIYLFKKEGFKNRLEEVDKDNIDKCYTYICEKILSEINHQLYFSDRELVIVNNRFIIKRTGTNIEPEIPSIKIINREYIRSLTQRAGKDIDEGNFDSALTKCRTLIEEVFCYAIEEANETPSDSGDIQKLYNQVKDLYSMHNNKDMDKRINTLLSGLNKIISAIALMRNKNSDSHGVGAKRINIEEHHARLMLNSASTVAEFLLAVVNKKQTQLVTNWNLLKAEF